MDITNTSGITNRGTIIALVSYESRWFNVREFAFYRNVRVNEDGTRECFYSVEPSDLIHHMVGESEAVKILNNEANQYA